MRVRENALPRWDFPAPNPVPPQDLGELPSIADLFGAVIIAGFISISVYIAYRIFVMPESKFRKIQRKFLQ